MGPREAEKGGESLGLASVVEKVVLEQFKPSGFAVKEKDSVGDEAGSSSNIPFAEGSRKRKAEGFCCFLDFF